MVKAAEEHAPDFENPDFPLAFERLEARQETREITALAMIPEREVISQIALIIKVLDRLHVDADLRPFLEQKVDKGAVSRTHLLERAQGHDSAVRIQLDAAVRIEEVESNSRDVE